MINRICSREKLPETWQTVTILDRNDLYHIADADDVPKGRQTSGVRAFLSQNLQTY
jgi:hypothetical protein